MHGLASGLLRFSCRTKTLLEDVGRTFVSWRGAMAAEASFGCSSIPMCLALACLLCSPAQHAKVSAARSWSPDLSTSSSSLRCVGNTLGKFSGQYGTRLMGVHRLVHDGLTFTARFRDRRSRGGRAALHSPDVELAPVVLVPGAGGNQLEVKLDNNKYKAGSFWCLVYDRSNYFRLWLDVFSLIPPLTSCFAERIQLLYDPDSDSYRNNEGVSSRVPYFGSTQGMQYLDPNFKSLSPYMSGLVAALENEGYVDNESLFGAPYDFRYAPGPNPSEVARTYLKDLQLLVESAYSKNRNRKVVIVAHSLGGLWTHYFLSQQPEQWLEKYVSHFVSVSTPWGGTVEQMKTYASGTNQGVSFLDPLAFRDEQRSSESNLWLLPVPRVFGAAPLVITPSRTYTAYDMEDFFHDIDFTEGIAPYKSRIPSLTDKLEAPKVPTTVMYARGVKTVETLLYNAGTFDQYSEIVYGDGDGTVNTASLTAVLEDWHSTAGQKLRVVELDSTTHSGCLLDSAALQLIIGEVLWKDAPSDVVSFAAN